MVQINICPDLAQNNSGQMVYAVIAKNQVDGMPFISHDWGFAKYNSVVRAVPILQAAMEYYLKIYKNGGSKDEVC